MARRILEVWLLLTAVGCGQAVLSSAGPELPNTAEDWLSAAATAEGQGRHGWGAQAIQNALDAGAVDHDRVLQLMQAWMAAGVPLRAVEAAERYTRRVRVSPALAAVWAQALGRLGRVREAVARWWVVAQARPEDPGPWLAAAELYAERLFAREAIAAYRQALVREPRHQGAMLGLGTLLLREGDSAEAERVVEQAVRNAPQDPAPRAPLGHIYRTQGRLALATAAFESAIERGGSPRLHSVVAELYYDAGELIGAEYHLRLAVDAYDSRPDRELLRTVIMTLEAERVGCEAAGSLSMDTLHTASAQRFVREGWTEAEAAHIVRASMADPGARRIMEDLVSRCSRTGQVVR